MLTSCGGGGGGRKKPPGNELPSNSEWVQGVKASLMEYQGLIKMTWTPRTEENVTYKVYRYESKASDATCVEFPGIQGNEFNDTSPIVDTPYYYRVTWVKDGNEYGVDAPVV